MFSCEIPAPKPDCSRAAQTAPMAGCEVKPDRTAVSSSVTRGRTINGDIDNIGTGLGTGEHTSNGDTGGVVRVDVDGEVGVGFSDSTNQPVMSANSPVLPKELADVHPCSLWLEETGHILDTKHMDSFTDKLISQVEIVL